MNINDVRGKELSILAIGAHKPILQSMLDFDFLAGKSNPSVVGVVTAGTKFIKLFWGQKEILVPCFVDCKQAAQNLDGVDLMFNANSGRRCYYSTREFFEAFPDAIGGHTFAEDTPEKFALDLIKLYQDKGKLLIGPAGVGMLIGGHLKLGAIGGTDFRQIQQNHLATTGNVAVLSASGGMVNEIITIVNNAEKRVSFAVCFGGDRFPYTDPAEAFMLAEADDKTELIIYYGELGGQDEYKIVELIKEGKITKPIIAYIAGRIGETFDQPVQFGHAKALARLNSETASAKQASLKEAGVEVADSVAEFVSLIEKAKVDTVEDSSADVDLDNRKASLFSTTIGKETESGYEFVGKNLTDWAKDGNFTKQIVSGLMGREPRSDLTVELANLIFMLSIDHGPNVSGAVNTIVTARAGKGLVDSLATGLLTVGPRFGGAVSGAAKVWFDSVQSQGNAKDIVEDYASRKEYIPGIGHKKYRLGLPDPRTSVLAEFVDKLPAHPHYDFAKSVEEITTAKKGNLILNVDGHIAAILLDVLTTEENMSEGELSALIDADFFNAFFVIPRSIGFISHYLDQKRLDEGLFRLPDDLVSS